MKKEDFKVGQTVYVYLIGNAARGKKTDEERIEEWEVVSIGRKYLHAKNKNLSYVSAKFDIANNFRQRNNGYSQDYKIYPTKEELLKDLWRIKVKDGIRMCIQYESHVLNNLSDEELETIYGILKKYEGCEE